MSKSYDLIIRNGTVYDGTGAGPRTADVAVTGNCIAAVGTVSGGAHEEIDAGGMVVTPGFVDVHTHYDGQVTWASRLDPTSLHGTTTVVSGNCGMGFAPCRPTERELLIKIMEGVEDIPDAVLTEGIEWEWETFPEYLDALERRRFDVDFGTQVPHAPVRVYTMGRRGVDREPATAADIDAMTRIVQEGLRAGGLGFTTSRNMVHRLRDGRLAPTVTAGEYELLGIARGIREVGLGVLQGVDDCPDEEAGFALWQRFAEAANRPFSISVQQRMFDTGAWKKRLDRMQRVNASGIATMRGQTAPRPIGILLGLDLSFNPFSSHPSWQELESLPLAEKVAFLRRPEVRARLLSEQPDDKNPQFGAFTRAFERTYPLGDPPDYEPPVERSIAAQARRLGKDVREHALDMLLELDGRAILYHPVNNFADNTFNAVAAMLNHPATFVGVSDGGAHVGIICDASTMTFMLSYWTRDRKGDKLPLETAISKISRQTASMLGLHDRGIVATGYKADLNVIDYDRLFLHAPYVVRDLPGGGRRLAQDVDGYVATVMSGVVTYRNGEFTGALPGRLIRGAQPAPN